MTLRQYLSYEQTGRTLGIRKFISCEGIKSYKACTLFWGVDPGFLVKKKFRRVIDNISLFLSNGLLFLLFFCFLFLNFRGKSRVVVPPSRKPGLVQRTKTGAIQMSANSYWLFYLIVFSTNY